MDSTMVLKHAQTDRLARRPSALWSTLLAVLSAVLLWTSPARAQTAASPSSAAQLEADALKLAGQALFVDHQQRNSAVALEKLERAIRLCADSCRPEVLAVLYRDRGVVYTSAQPSDYVAGMAAFRRAVELDPMLGLAPEYNTPLIRKAFAEARGFAHGGEALPKSKRVELRGDGSYVANTSLALEVHTSAEITHVQVHLKSKSMTTFEVVELTASGSDFRGEWPCSRVAESGARIDYYVVGTGYDDRLLGTLGSEATPLGLKLKRTADAPSACPAPVVVTAPVWKHSAPQEQVVFTPLPLYVEPPAGTQKVLLHYRAVHGEYKAVEMETMGAGFGFQLSCHAMGRTPGEFLYYFTALAADGSELASNGSPLAPYAVRIENEIETPAPSFPGQAPPHSCQTADDCPPEFPGCTTKDKPAPKTNVVEGPANNWLDLVASADFLALSSTGAACGGPAAPSYACYDSSGHETARQNVGINGNGLGSVTGGFSLATQRILLGYHRTLSDHFEAGVRLGLALGGGPDPNSGSGFTPVHGEARVAYAFKSRAEHARVAPLLEVAAGVAQVDASVSTSVLVAGSSGECPRGQRGCPLELDAWRRAGRAFASVGAGVSITTFDDQAVLVAVRGLMLFPTQGVGAALQLGYRLGF
jgi:hypothetical protein